MLIMKPVFKLVPTAAAMFFLSVSGSHGFELNGFADVSFTKCSRTDCRGLEDQGGHNGSFSIGELDFFAVTQMEQIDVLMEVTIENGSKVDLERLTLGYTFHDALRLRVGRFHTPLGFWNPTYHHGVQVQPTIRRPQFLVFEDEGGILPTHTVGIYFSGRVKNKMFRTEYGAGAGNGEKITVEDATVQLSPNNVSDDNPGKAVVGHLAVSPTSLPGLTVGGSGYFSRIQSDPTVASAFPPLPSVDENQVILAAALTYAGGSLDLTGEYFSIRDRERSSGGSGTHLSRAYYGLLSYTAADRWVPYLMYETTSVAEKDPYFINLGASDVTKAIGGIRYNLMPKSSVRAEARRVKWGDLDWSEYSVQWAIGF